MANSDGRVRILTTLAVLATITAIIAIIAAIIMASKLHKSGGGDIKHDTTFTGHGWPCLTHECVTSASEIVQMIDANVNPCDNFFEFVCSKYNKYVLDDDEVVKSYATDIQEETQKHLRALLEEESKKDEMESWSKVKKMYRSCMDTELLERRGTEPLLKFLESLQLTPVVEHSWNDSTFDLESMLVKLVLYNIHPFMAGGVTDDVLNATRRIFGVGESTLSLLSKDYYFKPKIMIALQKYISSLLKVFNVPHVEAEMYAARVVALEKNIAKFLAGKGDPTPIQERYKSYKLKDLPAKVSHKFDWVKYFRGMVAMTGVDIEINGDTNIIVGRPAYFKKLFALLENTPKRTLKEYITSRAIQYASPLLNKQCRDITFQFVKMLTGRRKPVPRWRKCVAGAAESLDEATSYAYVSKHFQQKSKQDILSIAADIRKSFASIMDKARWMDEETQNYAQEKLSAISTKIGYPDWILDTAGVDLKYRDYSMNESLYFENCMQQKKQDQIELLKQYTKERLRENNFVTTAFKVNAFYSPTVNSIVFPAAFLQHPYYSSKFPRSMNYGGIGSVIGHELTHGFDNKGRQFDKHGQAKAWWSDESIKNFKDKAQCIIGQYGNYTVYGQNLNGALTLGENIADNGGVKEAYFAYKMSVAEKGLEAPLPGLGYTHDQLFFINYARIWCNVQRPAISKTNLLHETHSPNNYRIIGTLQNFDEFSKAFNCPVGSYMNPKHKCSVW